MSAAEEPLESQPPRGTGPGKKTEVSQKGDGMCVQEAAGNQTTSSELVREVRFLTLPLSIK